MVYNLEAPSERFVETQVRLLRKPAPPLGDQGTFLVSAESYPPEFRINLPEMSQALPRLILPL